MSEDEFMYLDIKLVTPSLTNPRKHFNPTKLQELADSIKTSGVHQPVLVRPLPGSRVMDTSTNPATGKPRAVRPAYELVCGERRYRASMLANWDNIPALIRELTDAQVLEIQLVENLQRDDLTELEEAEGYEALMQHSHLTADQVGEKIGKSRSYVYARLKLLDLCQEARTSLRDRTVDASRALLVARIPDEKLQIKAMREIVKGTYFSDNEPMSARQAAKHVQDNYMLKLSDARFKITSEDLLPAAGSCKTCTKRTGHDPDLFNDVKSADVCTDPTCFHKKEEAHQRQQVKEAQAKGQTVLVGREAAELANTRGYNGTKFTGYRRLDSVEDSPTDVPLRKIIGAQMKAEGIKPTLIADPHKAGLMVECLPNEVASRLLKSVQGQAEAAKEVSKEVKALVTEKKAKQEAKLKDKFERDWRQTLVHDTWVTLRDDASIQAFNTDVHRYLAIRAAKSLSTDQAAVLCKWLNLGQVSPIAAVADFARETPAPDTLHLLIIMMEASGAYEHAYNGRIPNEGLMLVAGNVFGKQLEGVIDEIKGEVKAEIWPKPAKPAKAEKSDAPLAQPKHAAGKDSKGAKGKAKAPASAPRLSEGEALSGIAAAMQSAEASASAPEGAVAPTQAAPSAQDISWQPKFVPGQRVTVIGDTAQLNAYEAKRAGKTGTLTRIQDGAIYPGLTLDKVWNVTFKGRNGGVCLVPESHLLAGVA